MSTPMIEIHGECPKYRLELERIRNDWWLSLIHKATGNAQIVFAKNKVAAKGFFKGMAPARVKRFMDKANIPISPMYKPQRSTHRK